MQERNREEIMNALTQDLLREKRADRRWRNIRFIAWFILFSYLIISIFHYVKPSSSSSMTHGTNRYAALVRVDGMIAPGRGFSAEETIPILKEAFQDKNAEGVILLINSPGGTPVQAAIIHDAIITFKKRYHKKIIVIGEDLLTSGAYFIAVAADKIYVNANTLTGSIGVIMKGFGFVDAIKKLGIERRVYVSGDNKDRLDPFLPQNPDDLNKVKSVMEEVHQNFVQAVLQGRKGKLKNGNINLFNGDFWSGQTALKLGLVDGVGNLMDVMDNEFHATNYIEYGDATTNLFKLFGGRINSMVDTIMYS